MNKREAQEQWPVLLEDCFDYSVPPGWNAIVEDLMESLSVDPEIRVAQVKDKFASLRVYLQTAADDRADKLIHAAEEKCRQTCEDCGDNGDTVKTAGSSWIHTRCEKCREKAKS